MFRPALVASILLVSSAQARDLRIGDAVPQLKVSGYVQGGPVDLTKGLHIIEFWSTWAVPSRYGSIHLGELAMMYKGQLDVTAVAIQERGKDPRADVKSFLKDLSIRLNYPVAVDTADAFCFKEWFSAAKQEGVPVAFVVREGKLIAIDHPQALDPIIPKVLKGTFDLRAERARIDKLIAERAKYKLEVLETRALMAAIKKAYDRHDATAALKAIDIAEAKRPGLHYKMIESRLFVLRQDNDRRLYPYLRKLADGEYKNELTMLNKLAWDLVDPKTRYTKVDYKTAAYIAEKAATLSKFSDPGVLDTYALALFKAGQKKKAIAMESRALELANLIPGFDPRTKKQYQDTIASFKRG